MAYESRQGPGLSREALYCFFCNEILRVVRSSFVGGLYSQQLCLHFMLEWGWALVCRRWLRWGVWVYRKGYFLQEAEGASVGELVR
jgi:hypothetical protein